MEMNKEAAENLKKTLLYQTYSDKSSLIDKICETKELLAKINAHSLMGLPIDAHVRAAIDLLNNSNNNNNNNKKVQDIIEWVKQNYQVNNNNDNNYPPHTHESKLKFVGRKNSMTLLRNHIYQRWERRSKTDKQYHPIPFCAGSPGIGKTRFLEEASNMVKTFTFPDHTNITLNISFGNGSSYSDSETDMKSSFALRIINKYFAPHMTWSKFFKKTSNWVLDIDDALQAIKIHSGCKNVAIFVGMDEFNRVVEYKQQFQQIVNHIGDICLSSSSTGIFFIPVFCGTLYTSILNILRASSHPPFSIPIGLVDDQDTYQILDNLEWLGKFWCGCRQFRQCLSDMGGLPRAIDIFLQQTYLQLERNAKSIGLDRAEQLTTEQREEVISKLNNNTMSLTLGLIQAQYGSTPLPTDIINHIIQVSILGVKIHRANKLLPNHDHTWETLESCGQAIISGSEDYLIVELPFVIFWMFSKTINTIVNSPKWVDQSYSVEWKAFEEFNCEYQALRLNLFKQLYPNRDSITLYELFNGANFSKSEGSQISLSLTGVGNLKVQPILHQFPNTSIAPTSVESNQPIDWKSNPCLLLNSPGGPYDSVSTHPSDEIIVCSQYKVWTEDPSPIKSFAINEEEKKVKAANDKFIPNWLWILGIFTTRPRENPITFLKDTTFIVSRENFISYYGRTYASRAAFSINEKIC